MADVACVGKVVFDVVADSAEVDNDNGNLVDGAKEVIIRIETQVLLILFIKLVGDRYGLEVRGMFTTRYKRENHASLQASKILANAFF